MPKLTIKAARRQIAEAHQRNRDLQNELHGVVHPLRVQITELEAVKSKQTLELLRLTAMEARVKEAVIAAQGQPLTDAELQALAVVADLPDARARIVTELSRRGLLASGKSDGGPWLSDFMP